MGIAKVDGSSGGQGKQVGSREGCRLFSDFPVLVKFYSVQDNNPSPLEGVAGHERFGQIIQASSVNHDAGLSSSVNQRPAGSVAQNVNCASLGAIQEGLSHISINDHLSRLHDLAQLILGVSVDKYFQAVNPRPQIISRTPVHVKAHILSSRPQDTTEKSLSLASINNEFLPSPVVRLDQQGGYAFFPFRGEPPRI